MEIIETRTSAGLAALRQEWHVLLERCDTATIFQSWEWNDAWWQSFSHDKRLLLLKVRDRGTLVGLAPFYISRQPGTPFRRLALIGTGTSDYLDILAVPERAQEICTAILQYLATSHTCDLVDWHDLRPAAILRRALEASPRAMAADHELLWVDQEPCLSVTLPSTMGGISGAAGQEYA
jgi:CelD/BcsL family acetyltransferase involved in cellulose biosynthesis